MPGSTKTRGRSSGSLSTINPNAAGIDVGSTFHVVAVPGDRDDRPVRTFRTFSGDLHQLADWLREEREILRNLRARHEPSHLLDEKLGAPLCWGAPGSSGRLPNGGIASPLKNMVRGWLAHLRVVTPSGDPV